MNYKKDLQNNSWQLAKFTHFVNAKGIALVEVIAALGISVIVITSIVSLSTYALRTSLESKLLLQGTKVATREIELVRARRDSMPNDWDLFLEELRNNCGGGTNVCSIDPSDLSLISGVSEGNSGSEKITRSFIATKPDGSALGATDSVVRIQTIASWTIGSQTKSTNLYTDLTNWRTTN